MSFDPKGIILHPYESAVNSLHESVIVLSSYYVRSRINEVFRRLLSCAWISYLVADHRMTLSQVIPSNRLTSPALRK
jgi:hypothetical protein